MFSIASQEKFKLKKFDVKTAFLYSALEEEIYMCVPEGYDEVNKVCKLEKALYGLKQAPMQWNKRITDFLKEKGLSSLSTEKCIYVNSEKSLILAIYVDDGILIGQDEREMDTLLKGLRKEFEMTSCDEPTSFLGIDIKFDNQHLKLSQESYAKQVLDKFNMSEANSAVTPIVQNQHEEDEKKIIVKFPYRECVGSLLYLSTKTRPDISYAVGFCSRNVNNPSQQDVNNVKRIIRYIRGTTELGISYSGGCEDLIAYCDSDFAGDVRTRKSTSGYVIYYLGGPVSWRSRKQPIVATSSTEAEYIAAAECCRELIYLKMLIEELTGLEIKATLRIDNLSAISLIKNGVINRRSKHIDVRYHFIKEKFDDGVIKLEHCSTNEQIADIFTKSLGFNKFKFFKQKLMS